MSSNPYSQVVRTNHFFNGVYDDLYHFAFSPVSWIKNDTLLGNEKYFVGLILLPTCAVTISLSLVCACISAMFHAMGLCYSNIVDSIPSVGLPPNSA